MVAGARALTGEHPQAHAAGGEVLHDDDPIDEVAAETVMCRKRPFATRGQGRRPARAAVCRIPCLILCLADVEQKSMARRTSSSRNVRNGEASGATPRWRVWPCAGEWHPAFRDAPAHGPGACSCSAASARPVARVPRSRAGSYLWPVREPRRTGGRCPATAAPGHAPVPGGRAPLRGAALHEAEGRGGARGGGTGRVEPPPRLRLLRQIGDELVPGVEQFLLVDNVVAVEDGAALVAGQEHGDPLGDVCADQVARGGTAAVVKEAGRHPGRLAGRAPRRAPAADGDAVAVEDQWAVRLTACPSPRQGLGNGL